MRPMRRLALLAILCGGCAGRTAHGPGASARTAAAPPPAPPPAAFRLRLCSEPAVRLSGPPGETQTRGCVVTFRQQLSDPATIARLNATEVARRYVVYAPSALPPGPLPVVMVFPGYSSSAESMAFYTTHTRFETLADRDGFIVVYGNGLPNPPSPREKPAVPQGGFLSGCLTPHEGEGVDVRYVRQILDQLAGELPIDRTRV